jgi:hypothetical protein
MAGEIFISYRRSDQDKARLLHALLKQRGVDAWYDALVGAGEDWRHKTAQALGAAPIFVLLFSKVASESDDISKELAAATFSKKLVIPVRIDDIKPEGAFLYELASRNWFDAFEDTEARFEILADKLAALVKGGPEADVAAFNLGSAQPAPVIKPAARPLFKQPLVLAGIALAAVAVVSIAAMPFLLPNAKPTSVQTQSQRIAFFGFTTASDDTVASQIAETATSEAFRVFGVQQLEIAARADTVGVQQKTRIDRAAELGARFALSGEVNPEVEPGRVGITMRLEDVAARTAMWEETLVGDASAPLTVAASAATRATEMGSCVVLIASRLGKSSPDKNLPVESAVFCLGRGAARPETLRALRKLAQLAPRDGDLQGLLAEWLVIGLPSATPAARPAQMAEAEQTVARAIDLEPNGFHVATVRAYLASRRQSPAEVETLLTTSLQRAPDGIWETYGHGAVNITYADLLTSVGRTRAALPYFQTAYETGLFSVALRYGYVVTLAAASQPEAGNLLLQTFVRQPSSNGGQALLASAVLLGAGDAEKLLASPPSAISADVVQCWRDIRKANVSKEQKARTAGAMTVADCLAGGAITEAAALASFAALGDLDAAFALARKQTATIVGIGRGPKPFESLYWPTSRPMRADPRFLPLVEKEGLMEYWKTSGHGPDFCETEDVPVCRELKASAKP